MTSLNILVFYHLYALHELTGLTGFGPYTHNNLCNNRVNFHYFQHLLEYHPLEKENQPVIGVENYGEPPEDAHPLPSLFQPFNMASITRTIDILIEGFVITLNNGKVFSRPL